MVRKGYLVYKFCSPLARAYFILDLLYNQLLSSAGIVLEISKAVSIIVS